MRRIGFQPVPVSGEGPSDEPATDYAYDVMGNQTSVTDPDGNVTSFAFNQRNQVTSMTGPAVSGSTPVTAYKYDADGNLTETDTPDGNKILDTYDKDDRLTGQLYNNSGGSTVQAIGYTLDADGRITAAFSNVSSSNFSSNTENYTYDNDGRMTGQTTTYTGYGVVVALNQTFDADGNRLTLAATVNGTKDLLDTFTINDLGQLTTESQQGQSGGHNVSQMAVNFEYDNAGNLTTVDRYGNVAETTAGFTTSNTYDNDERLSETDTTGETGDFTYGYDPDNRMTSISSGEGELDISYDDDGRETAAASGGGSFASEAYTYDAAGNRLSATTGATSIGTIGVGSGNRISADAGGSYTYDSDGNRTLMNVSGGGKVFYTFNAADQLTGVTQNNSGGSTTQTSIYSFDPVTGQRLTLADSGTVSQTNLFVYDPTTGNSLLVLNATGAVTERDLPGQGLNQTLAFETGMTGSGSGTVYWLVVNNTGTVTNTENLSGTIETQTTFSTFGVLESTYYAETPSRFGFGGMVYDTATGLNYDNARFYCAGQGTFITQDPTGFGGGDYNLYRYAGRDLATRNDPTGLESPIGPPTNPLDSKRAKDTTTQPAHMTVNDDGTIQLSPEDGFSQEEIRQGNMIQFGRLGTRLLPLKPGDERLKEHNFCWGGGDSESAVLKYTGKIFWPTDDDDSRPPTQDTWDIIAAAASEFNKQLDDSFGLNAPQLVDINVVPNDWTEGWNLLGGQNYGNWGILASKIIALFDPFSDTTVHSDSTADMVDKIIQYMQEHPGMNIGTLTFRGHGNQFGFFPGPTSGVADAIDNNIVAGQPRYSAQTVAKLKLLKKYMAPGAKVKLETCFAGNNKDMLQSLADLTGAEVTGGTEGDVKNNLGLGTWVIASPGGKLSGQPAPGTGANK